MRQVLLDKEQAKKIIEIFAFYKRLGATVRTIPEDINLEHRLLANLVKRLDE